MRALVASGNPQTPLEIREVDEPSAGAGESIVEVQAISINRGELRLLARPSSPSTDSHRSSRTPWQPTAEHCPHKPERRRLAVGG